MSATSQLSPSAVGRTVTAVTAVQREWRRISRRSMRSRWDEVFCLRFKQRSICPDRNSQNSSCAVGPRRDIPFSSNAVHPTDGLRHQAMKQVRIDVAAGQDGDRDLALDVDLAGHQGGEPDGAAGLDDELEIVEGERHRPPHLLIARRDSLAN